MTKYAIEFDIKDMAPKIKVYTVTMGLMVMGPKDEARVDLCDHPDYWRLEQYVKNNPSGRKHV